MAAHSRYPSDDEGLATRTELICPGCEDALHLSDDAVELLVVQPDVVRSKLECYDILDENGDYAYEPHYWEPGCWADAEEELREAGESAPASKDALGILVCDACKSDVRALETIGLLRFGKLYRSPRRPFCARFETSGEEQHYCIACLAELDSHKGLWHTELRPEPEISVCTEGLRKRCWKAGDCRCKGSATSANSRAKQGQ